MTADLFAPDRRDRVRRFLDDWLGDAPGRGAETLSYKALSRSYKIATAQVHVRWLLEAIDHLVTGEPRDLGDGQSGVAMSRDGDRPEPIREGLDRAERLLDPDSLLLRHVRQALTARSVRRGGYIDWEESHLVLLGGRELLLRCVEALLDPRSPSNVQLAREVVGQLRREHPPGTSSPEVEAPPCS